MIPYYVAYGLMLLAAIGSIRNPFGSRDKKRKFYCIVWGIIWAVLIGLRHPSMGVDLQYGSSLGYLGRFQWISRLSWSEALDWDGHYEIGYVILNKLLSYIGTDYQVLLIACAVISIGFTAWWMWRNSDYPFLSSVIFLGLPCFLMNYSGLRQVLAISITLVAHEMIKQRKLIFFVLCVFVATCFHYSAWIFIFAYPLYWLRIGKKFRALTLFIPWVVYVFRFPLFAVLSRFFKEDAQVDYNNSITLFLVFWAVYLFSVLFGNVGDTEEQGWSNLFLIACSVQAFGGVYNTAIRVGYYFMVYLALLLPRIIANSGKHAGVYTRKSVLSMYIAIFVCFGMFGLFSISRGSWAMSNPYYFFWQV